MWEITSGPIKLGQVGFFSLGSSQNTQWTQVDQVHVAMVPFGPDYVQSWLIKIMMLKKRRPVSPNTDYFIFTSAIFPWVMLLTQFFSQFLNASSISRKKKKNTKVVFDFGLKGHFLIIFFKTI